MSPWLIAMSLLGLIAAVIGFSGIAGMASGLAKILLAVFIAAVLGTLAFRAARGASS